MRKLLLTAAGLTLLAPAALAQMALPGTPPAPGAAPPPPAVQPISRRPMAAALSDVERGGDMPPPPPPGGPRGKGGPGGPPPPPRGAHIGLERGDARLDLTCADDETTQACASIAGGLLDKLAALPAGPTARN